MALAFGHERDPDRVAAWLAETGRLLLDLPGEILATSIDEAIKRSDRGFLPAVGQIRAIAEPMLATRERQARRLDALVGLIEDSPPRSAGRAPDPVFDPTTRCTPEEAAKIMAEFGIRGLVAEHRKVYDPSSKLRRPDPARKPTEADYIAMMGEEAWRASQAAKSLSEQAL